MTNYMGSTIFLLVDRGMGIAVTDTINLLQKIGLLSIQKARRKRNISYYTPIINNETRLLSFCSLEESILKTRIQSGHVKKSTRNQCKSITPTTSSSTLQTKSFTEKLFSRCTRIRLQAERTANMNSECDHLQL
jgi:hypothetical protein